jgi:hypothetical protein
MALDFSRQQLDDSLRLNECVRLCCALVSVLVAVLYLVGVRLASGEETGHYIRLSAVAALAWQHYRSSSWC